MSRQATAAPHTTQPSATRLAVPLIAYSLIGNATGLAVLAMLGHLGVKAIAGAGIGNVALSLLMALIFGFDTGVQALVSRAAGAGAHELAGRILSEAFVVSIPFGFLLCAICASFGPHVASVLTQDGAVAAQASAYLVYAAPSLVFLATTIPFNAYWIATGNPRITFFVTSMTVPAQIAIAWLLIFGAMGLQGLGVGGAGLAVTAGTFFGLLIQLALGTRLKRIEGLFRYRPRPSGVAAILAIGWPVSLQQSLVQLGSVISFAIISHLGVAVIAIVNVLGTLALVPTQTAVGIGTACGTLVGQALGRGYAARAKRWGWQLAGVGALLLAPLGLVAVIAPRMLLSFFLHDPRTLMLAMWPTQLLGLSVGIDAVVWILSFALRGAGATKIATIIPFLLRWAFQLPLIWWVGVKLHFGINGMATVLFALATIEALAFAYVWSRGRWARTGLSVFSGGDKCDEMREGRSFSRVWIVGGAGAGKSTLARQIGGRLHLPVIHLDRLMYGPHWRRNDLGSVRANLEADLGESWVVEGTYPQLADLILPRAELVVWLEQPTLVRLWRTWRKTRIHRQTPRADRPDDCEERFTLGYAATILSFGRFTSEIEWHLKRATTGKVVRLKSDRAVARFLRTLPRAWLVPLAA